MPAIRDHPLAYVRQLAERPLAAIDLVVMHCTELPDLATARSYGERVLYLGSGTGASGHYYIDRDGRIECWVAPERIAHHTRGYNPRSLGIELVNLGRYPDWLDSRRQVPTEPYPQRQIAALLALLAELRRLVSSLRFIAGHEDLDTARVPASDDSGIEVRRKIDPGPLFPWETVLSACGLTRLRP
jgi:N-acetylmuramoyl-L-alanine amidase